jgi:hypothetical protein
VFQYKVLMRTFRPGRVEVTRENILMKDFVICVLRRSLRVRRTTHVGQMGKGLVVWGPYVGGRTVYVPMACSVNAIMTFLAIKG